MNTYKKSTPWFVLGDLNGFFGLMFDNLTVLSFLAGILIFVFKYPADIVYTRIFPGTAFGVLFGNLVYTGMALRLARRKGDVSVTAMPLGLDTPSTIGIALVVLGPAFANLKAEGWAEREAALMAWYIGMATMLMMGGLKTGLSFCGGWIQKVVPRAGLLGSLAGIGLVLIGFIPLVDIFGMPLVGMVSLGVLFYNLVGKNSLPKNFPGVLAAILIGTALYYFPAALPGGRPAVFPSLAIHFSPPVPTIGFLEGVLPALKYLPVAIPFAVLTVVGGINVTESARLAGDDFKTRDILLTEAAATIIAGICGGVAQTTPYIGQPAYKRMGARAGYTLLTGVFIGLGGILGYVSFFVELIPRAVLAPILVFVALEIMAQAFKDSSSRHAPAVAFAFFPTVAHLLAIKLSNPEILAAEKFQALLSAPGQTLPELLVTISLGNGFILTGMLWGAFLAEIIDRRFGRSALFLMILAVFSFFGIVHSPFLEGGLFLPWHLAGTPQRIPFQFSLAYAACAGLILILGAQAREGLQRSRTIRP